MTPLAELRSIRPPPVDVSDAASVSLYAAEVLIFGPERVRAAAGRLLLHKHQEAECEKQVRMRRQTLLLLLNAELKASGARTNEKERDAMLDERVWQDAESITLAARLDDVRELIAQATMEFEDDRLAATRSLARLLGRD